MLCSCLHIQAVAAVLVLGTISYDQTAIDTAENTGTCGVYKAAQLLEIEYVKVRSKQYSITQLLHGN